MKSYKIYHFCPKDHATAILKGGFKKPVNEKIVKNLLKGSKFIAGQQNKDAVSFTACHVEAFKNMVAISHIMKGSMKDLKVELSIIELDIKPEDLIRVFPSSAALIGPGGQIISLGVGLEITVDRSKVNSLIKLGMARLVNEKKMKSNKEESKQAERISKRQSKVTKW